MSDEKEDRNDEDKGGLKQYKQQFIDQLFTMKETQEEMALRRGNSSAEKEQEEDFQMNTEREQEP